MTVLLALPAGLIGLLLGAYGVYFALLFFFSLLSRRKARRNNILKVAAGASSDAALSDTPISSAASADSSPLSPKTRFAVVVAARNEEAVIGALVDSLLNQSYPRERYDVIVVPNQCRDQTALRAREHGARVLECTVPVSSKGDVLRFAFSCLLGENRYDAFCIFDADNVVDPHFLEAMNAAFCGGARIVQGYRESANPEGSWISSGYSVYFRMIAEWVNRPRADLNMPVLLGGTGWAVSADCLRELGWQTHSIAEDCEYSLYTLLEGEKILWVPEAVTYDEQPLSFRQSVQQRRRWSSGMLELLPLFGRELIRGLRSPAVENRHWYLDGLISLSTPLIHALSLLPGFLGPLLLAAAGAGIGSLPLLILGSLLLNILGTTAGAALLALQGPGYRKGMWKGVLTYWIFLGVWSWISLFCLFRRERVWEEIRHTGGKRPGGLLKIQP